MKAKKNYYIIVFIVLFIISMVIHIAVDNTECHYDDAVYWSLGRAYGWDVRNISWGFRGWLLPFLFSMCYKFGMIFNKEFFGYWIFSSFEFAVTFTFLFRCVVKLLGYQVEEKYTALAGGMCGIIFFIFFRGLFIYTLSDFYAFSFSLLSIILVHALVENEQKWYVKVSEALFLGICLYGTYNIRTIYLFLLIACLGILIFWQLYEKKWVQLILTLPACFAGILICSIPQMILNHKLLGERFSWKVPTENLMLFQLHCGISTGRYATYIGEPSQYSVGGMFFVDNIGQTILERVQMTEFTSYDQVVKLAFRYPLDFAGIYMRHLLNMLYPIYPNQYIEDITKDKSIFLLLFYTILFISLCSFFSSLKIKKNRIIWLFLILLPCIFILPGAVEIRFFIALHFVIYMYGVLGIKQFILYVRNKKIKFFAAYLTGLLLYIAYAGTLLATTTAGIATIN